MLVIFAAAHHHYPRRIPKISFDMPLVVYVANVLAHERVASTRGLAAPSLDMELLEQAGVAEKLADWRKIAEVADTEHILLVS